jgi:glucose-6-phosphate isomerase, archaeal
MAVLSDPRLLSVDVKGQLAGNTGVKRTRIADLKGCFAETEDFEKLAALRGGDVAYEVQEFRPGRVAPQELVFGTSTLAAGKVGDEYFMTRGHLHVRADRPEVYFCQAGKGVLHMEAPDGSTRPMTMSPGDVVYVPGFWIHRSVNVGSSPFVTTFFYPADAGQDYEIIVRSQGMRTLIVDDGAGGWVERDNPRYRPRSPAEQQHCLASDAVS